MEEDLDKLHAEDSEEEDLEQVIMEEVVEVDILEVMVGTLQEEEDHITIHHYVLLILLP